MSIQGPPGYPLAYSPLAPAFEYGQGICAATPERQGLQIQDSLILIQGPNLRAASEAYRSKSEETGGMGELLGGLG
jgi:hypothetical protein